MCKKAAKLMKSQNTRKQVLQLSGVMNFYIISSQYSQQHGNLKFNNLDGIGLFIHALKIHQDFRVSKPSSLCYSFDMLSPLLNNILISLIWKYIGCQSKEGPISAFVHTFLILCIFIFCHLFFLQVVDSSPIRNLGCLPCRGLISLCSYLRHRCILK